MEDWQKELIAVVENLTREAGTFLEELSESVEEVAQQFQEIFIHDLESFWQEFFEFVDASIVPQDNPEFINDFLNPKVEPSLENYPACVGCTHYHGRMYGQQILICGMHPYGWTTDESCPDWEKDSPKE